MKTATACLSLAFCLLLSACVIYDPNRVAGEPSAQPSGETAPKNEDAVKTSTEISAGDSLSVEKEQAGSAAARPSARSEYAQWLQTSMLACFGKNSPQGQPWSAEAQEFLRDACQAESDELAATKTWAFLANQAQNLSAKGCEDPLLKLWMGEALCQAGKFPLALGQLKRAAVQLQKWEYPRLALALASDRLAWAALQDPSSQELGRVAMNSAAGAMAECAVENPEYAPPSQFAVYAGMLGLRSCELNPKFWRVAAQNVAKIGDYPPWLKGALLLRAKLEENLASPQDPKYQPSELFSEAKALESLSPGRPETPALALEVLAAFPSAGSPDEAKALLKSALARQNGYPQAILAYIDYLAAGSTTPADAILAFGRQVLRGPVPELYAAALLKTASSEPSCDWRAAFAQPGVAEELDALYLKLINACPPQAKDRRDRLAMERVLFFAWCGKYDEAKELLSKMPLENSLLSAAFPGERILWKPKSIPELEAELRAFTGAQKEQFRRWDADLAKGDPDALVKSASKLIASSAGDKPLRSLIRSWTAWHLSGVQASQIPFAEEQDPLAFALRTKKAGILKFLLETGYEIKRKGRESSQLLLTAMANGLPEDSVRLLIAKGADVDWRDPESGATPLTAAIEAKLYLAAEFMAEMGADANARLAGSGFTPLHMACQANAGSLVKTLLRRGAKPNVQDALGKTPLHYAVQNGSFETVQGLLARAADPTLRDADGKSPIDLAEKRGEAEMAEFMKTTASQRGLLKP